jgi:glycosyltransferase involved in cell wall biosynthesis
VSDPAIPSVAFVIDKYAPFVGGAERQAALLAGLLASRIGRCDVFTAQSGMSPDGTAVVVRRLGTSRLRRLRHGINFLAAFRAFLAHGQRYTVVHGHALSGLVCGGIVGGKLRGCATVIKICSVGSEGDIAKLRRQPLGRVLWPTIRRFATFMVPTPTLVPELLAAGVPPPRIVSIPNSIGPVIPGPPHLRSKIAARAELDLPERPTALFVGRLSPEKGPDVLMRAWDQIPPECDATLVVVGGGTEAARVADWARRPARADRVRPMGIRLDIERLYRAADVLVVPSRSETFSNVLAEGMAHGLAVVTTPVGLAQHWIRHGENGIIVRGEDGRELAHALHQLLGDERLRDRLGGAARLEALSSFSPEPVVEQYLDLYQRLAPPALVAAGL